MWIYFGTQYVYTQLNVLFCFAVQRKMCQIWAKVSLFKPIVKPLENQGQLLFNI